MVTAAGAAYLGLRSAIVEKAQLGGDCLWTGCVPSKALIASGRLAHEMRRAGDLGLRSNSSDAQRQDFRAVMERMRTARSTVAVHDEPDRFREMGVDVHFGSARFVSASELHVEDLGPVFAKRFVVATGATAAVPPIPGLAEAGYWTYENVFDEDELPASITILGGGPIGVEFAQLFARLGAKVTVVEMAPTILTGEDADVADFMQSLLEGESITVRTATVAASVSVQSGRKTVVTGDGEEIHARELFVATGRLPATQGLDLDAAGVRSEKGSVSVDAYLRTSAKSVWAAGDVTGGPQFTHAAEQMAKAVLRNAVVPGKSKVRLDNLPRVTFSDPEVAHVGMSQEQAEASGGTTYRYEMQDLDRAIVDGSAVGFVKISADRKGRVLGATIVAHGAGELLMPLVLARQHGLKLGQIASTIFPYPTMVEGVKRASNAFMRSRLESTPGRTLKRIIRWLK